MKTISMIICMIAGMVCIMGIAAALNPLSDKDRYQDPDMDGLTNLEEFNAGSDPNNWDTDADGLPDGWEVDNRMDPADPRDAELDSDYWDGEQYSDYSAVPEDHYNNYDEYYRYYMTDQESGRVIYRATDPNNPDTDGDNIMDPDDVWPWDYDEKYDGEGTTGPTKPTPGPPNPMEPVDFDGDGILDYDETLIGTDPWNPDTDGDGLSDSQELALDLDPNDWDTDNDMLIDGVEMGGSGSTDGHLPDTDDDGIC
jgi:hypothetical protein